MGMEQMDMDRALLRDSIPQEPEALDNLRPARPFHGIGQLHLRCVFQPNSLNNSGSLRSGRPVP